MKIRYWNYDQRQITPKNWYRSALVKPQGLIYDDFNFRKIVDMANDYDRHEFLVPTPNLSLLYRIGDHVLPMLHINSAVELNNKFSEYAAYCNQERKPKIVTLFCQNYYEPSMLEQIDWVFLVGNNYNSLKQTLGSLMRSRIPHYVEYYRGNKAFNLLPREFQRRQILREVVSRVAGHDFLEMYNEFCQGDDFNGQRSEGSAAIMA